MHPSSTGLTRGLPFRRFVRLGSAALVGATLAACTAAPLSYLNDRQVYYRAVLNRYPLRVVSIDGSYQTFNPVPIAPGEHLLTLDAVPVAGFSQPIQKQYPMTIAPCTRYYIAAQRTSPLTQDWTLVVEETWPVAGCDPAKELQKAKIAGVAGPAASSAIASRTEVASTTSPITSR